MSFIPSVIKSIQRGTVSITGENSVGNTTISAVNLSFAVVNFLSLTIGSNPADGQLAQTLACDIYLSSTTNVQASRSTPGSSDGLGSTSTLSFEVIEFISRFIKSIQVVTSTLGAGVGSNTAAISAVNVAKSTIFYQGSRWSGLSNFVGDSSCMAQLTSSTVITFTRGNSGRIIIPRATVVEFR